MWTQESSSQTRFLMCNTRSKWVRTNSLKGHKAHLETKCPTVPPNPLLIGASTPLHSSIQGQPDPCRSPDGGFLAERCTTIKQSHHTQGLLGGGREHAGVPGGLEGGWKVRGTAAEWESFGWCRGGSTRKKGRGGAPLFSLSVK